MESRSSFSVLKTSASQKDEMKTFPFGPLLGDHVWLISISSICGNLGIFSFELNLLKSSQIFDILSPCSRVTPETTDLISTFG